MNKRIFSKIGAGLALVGIPASIGLISMSSGGSVPDSNYLREKGYSNCKDNCSELSAGYEWAKTNNVCDAKYNKGPSESYNIGVHAWAWDVCAYSTDEGPI